MNRPTPVLISLAGLLMAGSPALAGNLAPLAGPVGPTMKTLDEVEPRVLIDQTDVPLTIIRQGSYYLTENLIAKGVGQDCITVLADDVTLDLMGFTIGGSEVGVWDRGVTIHTNAENVTIRNGTVRDCSQDGITGVAAPFASSGMRVIDVRSLRNGGNGMSVGSGSTITSCSASFNTGTGISASSGSTITACSAWSNGSIGIFADSGSTVTDCAAWSNGSIGIFADSGSTITACAAWSNTFTGINASAYATISGCSASSNGTTGIAVGIGSTITDCAASSNGTFGISALSGSTITGCSVSFNSDDGINASSGSTVAACVARSNLSDGIHVGGDCTVRGNTCVNNGLTSVGAGIHATSSDSRIEDNLVTDNDLGIEVDFVANFIIRNSANENTIHYDIVAGNKVGVIVLAPSSAAILGSTGGAGVGTTDPWANFSY